jgi:two-component system chemotaxis response regulator CheB
MGETAKVLIVDDQRTYRDILEAALAGQVGVSVVGSVFSGEKALEHIRADPPDVVTLDVRMPGLDGLATLREIQRFNAARPRDAAVGVVMVSAYTRTDAEETVRALAAGAFDCVAKPDGPSPEANLLQLRGQLLRRIRSFLAERGRARQEAPHAKTQRRKEAGQEEERPGVFAPLREALRSPPRAVLVATSTGGPRALVDLLPALRAATDLPVFVVQHMPPLFSQSVAEVLAAQTGVNVVEARDGEVVRPGTVYVAPGDRHLLLRAGSGGRLLTGLNEQPPENGFRPSADVLFRSAAAALGGAAVAVVLTGLESGTTADGVAGLRPLRRAGGYVIAQDEATSVAWGMPGSVVREGLADAVLPLGRIAEAVRILAGGGAPP